MISFPIKKVETVIGVVFEKKAILKQAFIHRSYLNENLKKNLVSNERLEFLGDAILEFWVSKIIFSRFPYYPEGDLTNFRSRVVYTKSLTDIAQNLTLGQFLLFSAGEKKEGGQHNPGLLANTFEALVGAIFQDQGLKKTEQFLEKNVLPRIEAVSQQKTLKDYKSRLQEWVQEQDQVIPEYRLLESKGPDHDRIFHIGVFIKNKKIAQGQGSSKQKAEQLAAKKSLEKLIRK